MPNDDLERPTLAEVIDKAIRAKLLDLHTALPARIEKYYINEQKADIKPLLSRKYKNNGINKITVEIPIIPGVPVHHLSSNDRKSYIHLPIKKGDLGMAVFCERSIDKWLSGEGQIVSPDDPRHHSLSDAFFIPGILPFSQAIQGLNGDDLTIANDLMKITLYPDGKVSIEGVSEELIAVLSGFFQHVQDSTMVTTCPAGAGTGQMDPATKTILASDKTKLDTLKK